MKAGSAKIVREKAEPELLKIPGVVGVSHANEKVILYLESKQHLPFMPTKLAGIPVECRVVGRIVTLSKVINVRPLVGGISCAHYELTAGTLGMVTFDGMILSNNHVIGKNNEAEEGDAVLQPGKLDGGKLPDDKCGEFERLVPIKPEPEPNLVDAAVAKPTVNFTHQVTDVGAVAGWTDPLVDMDAFKSGRTTCLTSTRIIDVEATVIVDDYPWGTSIFEDQIIVSNYGGATIRPGDSGSLLLTKIAGENYAVGLIFAGSFIIGVANRIKNVIDLLGIDLGSYRSPPPPPPARVIPFLIGMPVLFGSVVTALTRK